MKSLTKADVKRIAFDLINQNGATTALDVKNQLRAGDYFAKQDEVSKLLGEVAAEENWSRQFSGGHYEYSLPQAGSTIDPNSASPSQQLLNLNTAAATPVATNVQDAVAQAVAPDPNNLP